MSQPQPGTTPPETAQQQPPRAEYHLQVTCRTCRVRNEVCRIALDFNQQSTLAYRDHPLHGPTLSQQQQQQQQPRDDDEADVIDVDTEPQLWTLEVDFHDFVKSLGGEAERAQSVLRRYLGDRTYGGDAGSVEEEEKKGSRRWSMRRAMGTDAGSTL
ncbi:8cddbab4-7f24-4833-a483-d35bcd5c65bf [Thermothielavioides terrestris]|uniref:8cddbab4-7f24-4833-a483-d35bcd5c65bf n=1 Tax=Thermothielavioides terrestris TaxID=2587410 RepID=A0A446BV48_9PEZI|nr:8cddbab4-7f24-4833-a483-d35bcd5c65bf [Thermothielavioides terrestris]